jgi:hypothetical protein
VTAPLLLSASRLLSVHPSNPSIHPSRDHHIAHTFVVNCTPYLYFPLFVSYRTLAAPVVFAATSPEVDAEITGD